MKFKLHIDFFKKEIIQFKTQLFALSTYLLATIVSSVIGIIINPFLARNLSHADYALIGYFTSFGALVLPLVGFSFSSYYARNYFHFNDDKRSLMKDTILTSFLVLGPLVMSIVLIAFYFYTRYAGISFSFSPYAFLSFIPSLFGLSYSLFLTELRMRRDAKQYFYISVSNSIIGVALAIGLVVIFHLAAFGRLMATLIVSVLFGIYSYLRFSFKFRFDKIIFIDALKFCWPLTLAAIMYYFLSGVDRAMLDKLHDVYTFGLYNVAFQISAYLTLFGTAIFQTIDPDIYKATAENNVIKLVKILAFVLVFTTIPALLFALFAEPLIALLTFGRYIEAAPLSRILALRVITTAFAFVISGIIIGYGFPKVEFVNRVLGAILSFFMFRYLISCYGFYGAAWGQVLSMFIMSLISLMFIIYKKRHQILSLLKI